MTKTCTDNSKKKVLASKMKCLKITHKHPLDIIIWCICLSILHRHKKVMPARLGSGYHSWMWMEAKKQGQVFHPEA